MDYWTKKIKNQYNKIYLVEKEKQNHVKDDEKKIDKDLWEISIDKEIETKGL